MLASRRWDVDGGHGRRPVEAVAHCTSTGVPRRDIGRTKSYYGPRTAGERGEAELPACELLGPVAQVPAGGIGGRQRRCSSQDLASLLDVAGAKEQLAAAT